MPDQMGPWSLEILEQVAHPYPVEWLFPPAPAAPPRIVNLFAGPGGWCVGIRDALGFDVDMIGVELNRDAAATAVAAGFRRIVADVTTLNPHHPALLHVVGLIFSAPCQPWTQAGKRAGHDQHNLQILLDMFVCAWEATIGVRQDQECTEECPADCDDCYEGWSGPIYGLDEVRAMAKDMTDQRVALLAEVVIWGLALSAGSRDFRWIAMEQSSSLPQAVIDGIREEFQCADWLTVDFQVLDAADYGLASRRKRAFMLAARHRYLDLAGTRPVTALPTTTAAQALNWPPDIKIRTRGNRVTAGGNDFPLDKPATAITGKIRAWYPVNDPNVRFTLDEAALLVGILPGYPWKGSRTAACQQIGDVVSPVVVPPVIGTLVGRPWEAPLRHYLSQAYGHPGPYALAN
ncbi:DNA cytosine methyltransferase [Kitasatospora sp. NPDC001540]|uniref:DNA cytosine methyltransferase n=1 Tax=Kitasatospora sp. NPDC001540 TaxID=3364014 RepID=UPI0036B283A3